jgi:uncharacterized protein (DUF488 family)
MFGKSSLQLFTIGHSTRTIEQLIGVLTQYKVGILVDIRSYPGSRRNPQFGSDAITQELSKHGFRYLWLPILGGRRKGLGDDSKNKCWKNQSFRNYADYMETATFRQGIDELIQLSSSGTVAIMCAEAVYWRCHRSMVADFLKSLDVQVTHIFDEKKAQVHEYTRCAKIIDGHLTYRD